MGFASGYLEQGTLFPSFIFEPPAPGTGIIVVIPAFDEPDIAGCLSSLARCTCPPVPAEVMIIVNSPASSGAAGLEANARTLRAIDEWHRRAGATFFRLDVFDAGQPSVRGWGVGTARKTGMDEAARRFNILDARDGVIVSLDADCDVSENYFTAIWNDFALNGKAGGCSINFSHREEVKDIDQPVADAIRQYELHMRYFVGALRYTGYPYPFHTIGSAIAVKAHRYVRAGGMSRRQGGEDFYFIQKLVVSDDFVNLNSTMVFPSPRLSRRVPFGTGPAVMSVLKNGTREYLTYAPESFIPLREFFRDFSNGDDPAEHADSYNLLPSSIRYFVDEAEWRHMRNEIAVNTSSPAMYSKRFFSWFNTFRIVKYLNSVHRTIYRKIPVLPAASELLRLNGVTPVPDDLKSLLGYYRMVDSF